MDEARSVERRVVTVLFADLVGFTSLSEQLDPEDVATVQEAYFGAVRDTVGRYGGRLEKFIGDAAMAVFGVPRARDDDAERAVRAGLALTGAIEQIGARLGLDEGALSLRVGANTGEVLYTERASGEWLVTGDPVNVAARLQAAARPGTVLIGEPTSLAVAGAVELDPIGSIELKGKAEPVRSWHAVRVRPEPSREHAMGALRAPILGREAELDALREALVRTSGGSAERWVIVAPPGVGKTRLVEEFAHAAGHAGAHLCRARLRADVVGPYQPVAQLVASSLARAGTALGDVLDPERRRRAAHDVLVPRLSRAGVPASRAAVVAEETLDVTWPSGKEPAPGRGRTADREVLFAAWLDALDALAEGAAEVWVVEDVHWAGGDFLAFLAFAQDRPGRRLILATTRPSLLDSASSWCRDAPDEGNHLVQLSQLSPGDARELVRALVGAAVPDDLAALIARRSDGNPLFIEELLRTWISVGLLAEAEGRWTLTAAAGQVRLPHTVQAIYAGQIDDLPPEARLAARRASVAGRRFPIAALEPLEVPGAGAAVETLRRRALVSGPEPDPFAGDTYSFRHALLRDAGYASLARAERARLHVLLARWIEEAAAGRVAPVAEVIAGHYASALESSPALAAEVAAGLTRVDVTGLAAAWFERAAEAALEVAAHDAARTLLRRALDLTGHDDMLSRARLYRRLGDATAYVSDMDAGAAAYEEAAALFRAALSDGPDSEDHRTARAGLAGSISSLGLVRIQQLRFKEAIQLAEATLGEIGIADDLPTAWLKYLRAWGNIAWQPRPESRPDLEAALRVAESQGDRRLELESRFLLLSMRMEAGEIDMAASNDEERELAVLAEEEGLWDRACRQWRTLAVIRCEEADERWTELLDRSSELAEAHGLAEEGAWIDYARTEIGLLRGDWDGATAAALRAFDLADRNAYHRVQVRTWSAFSPIADARGSRDLLRRGSEWFEAHQAIFPPSPFGRFLAAAMYCRLADAGLAPVPELGPDLLEFWDEYPGWASGYAAMETVTRGWLAAGRGDLAGRGVEAAARWLGHPSIGSLYAAVVDLLRARVGRVSGRPAQGTEESLRRALNLATRINAPWWEAKAIRELEASGHAGPDDVARAEAIEGALGLVGPAV